MVDNRPLPAKPSGLEAVAAFRAGQTSGKKSKQADAATSASKDSHAEKKKRKSIAPTSPSHSPATPPTSPPPSGSGRKRKAAAAVVEAARKEKKSELNDDADDSEDETASPLDAALADFVPASLTALPPSAASQPLWLFQFPAKFDVAAFSALRLSLATTKAAATAAGRIVSRFQLGGTPYRIVEAESTDATDIVNLLPAPANTTNTNTNLTPGRPFTRLLRITLDTPPTTATHTTGSSTPAGWQHSTAALKRKAAVPAARGLTVHFRPIGWMDDTAGQAVGQRRGKEFRKVGYERVRGEVGEAERKKRRKTGVEEGGKENGGKVREREAVGEKKQKKKSKDKQPRESR